MPLSEKRSSAPICSFSLVCDEKKIILYKKGIYIGIDKGSNNSYTNVIILYHDWRDIMKTAISMPDDLFKDIDKLSKKLNCSRSHILTSAAREYVKKLKNKNIYEAINKAYSEKETEKETVLREKHKKHYAKMLKMEKW